MTAPRHLRKVEPRGRPHLTLLLTGAFAVLAVGGALFVDSRRGDVRVEHADAVSAGADHSTTTTAEVTTTEVPDAATTTRGELGSGAPVTIAFVGDMNFEGALRTRLDSDPTNAVGPFAATLRGADLAIGNLETAIAVAGTRADKQFAFRAPPSAVGALRAAGLDAVSMANNHGMDYGVDGLTETLAAKRTQPDAFLLGVGGEEDEAFAPLIAQVKGQRVAIIAATQVLDSSLTAAWTATATQGGLASAKRVDRLVAEVEAAREAADTVVVFLHWGIEKETCPSGDQRTLARLLVDAGADVVVGSHAHRLQGGGRLGHAVVHYGLGNFLFNANSPDGARTGVFEVTVTGRRVDGYRWIPGQISRSVPAPLGGADADAAQAHWQGLRSCTGLAP